MLTDYLNMANGLYGLCNTYDTRRINQFDLPQLHRSQRAPPAPLCTTHRPVSLNTSRAASTFYMHFMY
jgi:hypothetical protein